MSFWCLQFPPKNERKQVNLRYHSSKVEFVCSFFGGNWWPQKIISKLTNIYQLLSKTHSAYRDLLNTREERLKLCLLLRRSGVSPGRPRSLLMSEKSVWFTSMMSTSHLCGPSRCINSSKFTKELWTIHYHKGRPQHIFCFNNKHLGLVRKSVRNLSSIDW